jgi:hypothetical protein
MKTLYIAVNEETKGPYTPEQIYAMWQGGNLPANSLYFNNESQEWEALIDVINSFKPLTGFAKLIAAGSYTEPTDEERIKCEQDSNKGGIILSLIGASIFLIASISFFQYSFKDIVTEHKYELGVASNPTPVKRNIFHVNSPEEERAYQQKVRNSFWTTEDIKTERNKTKADRLLELSCLSVCIGLTVYFCFLALKYYKKTKVV